LERWLALNWQGKKSLSYNRWLQGDSNLATLPPRPDADTVPALATTTTNDSAKLFEILFHSWISVQILTQRQNPSSSGLPAPGPYTGIIASLSAASETQTWERRTVKDASVGER